MGGAVVLVFVAAGALGAAEEDGQEGVDYATFEASRLRCVIGNNGAKGEHRQCYNGLFRLWSPDQEQTPFVPFYAGWIRITRAIMSRDDRRDLQCGGGLLEHARRCV